MPGLSRAVYGGLEVGEKLRGLTYRYRYYLTSARDFSSASLIGK